MMYRIACAGDVAAVSEEMRLLAPNSVPEISAPTDGVDCHVLVLDRPWELPGDFRASAVAVNTDELRAGEISLRVPPRLVLTYGLNRKASITASGFADGQFCVCVQRAFVTPWGKRRERQEFTVPTRNPAAALAAISAALAADLETLFF